MNYKLIAVDLDGTLLNSNSQISDENLSAISKLAEMGVKTTTLTGRTYYEIPDKLREFDALSYCVYSNGAGIKSKISNKDFYNPISKPIAKAVFNIISEYDTMIEFYSNGYPFLNKANFNNEAYKYFRIDDYFIPVMPKTRKPIDDISVILDNDDYNIEMIHTFFRNEDERQECINRLKNEIGGIDISFSMTSNLEVFALGVNKGAGLKKLCELADISIDDVLVVGDSNNDVTAFQIAKNKYAVSNACDNLKNISTKIICSNDEHIMQYILNEIKKELYWRYCFVW